MLNPNKITSKVTSVNNKTGAVSLSASDVGARPSTWTPSASEVGARPSTWTPTASEVGAVAKIGDTMTGDLTFSGATRSIGFNGGDGRYTPISFYKGDVNGVGITIGGGGRTIIGGGESATNLRGALGGSDASEEMHIASDGNIYLHTNGQTIAQRKTITINTNANISAPGGFTGNLSGTATNATNSTNAINATNLAAGGTILASNAKLKFFPGWSYTDLGIPASDCTNYILALVKKICATYPGIENGYFIGPYWPDSRGTCYIHIYNTSDLQNSVPRYADGICQRLQATICGFSISNYSLSVNDYPGINGALPIANGGTGTNTAEQALSNLNGYPKTGGTITGSITTTITSDENNIKVTHTNGTLGIFGNTLSGNRGMWDSDPTRSQKYVIQYSNSTKNYTFHGNADTATSAETANSAPASGITGQLSVLHGGTGTSSATGALTNLGIQTITYNVTCTTSNKRLTNTKGIKLSTLNILTFEVAHDGATAQYETVTISNTSPAVRNLYPNVQIQNMSNSVDIYYVVSSYSPSMSLQIWTASGNVLPAHYNILILA